MNEGKTSIFQKVQTSGLCKILSTVLIFILVFITVVSLNLVWLDSKFKYDTKDDIDKYLNEMFEYYIDLNCDRWNLYEYDLQYLAHKKNLGIELKFGDETTEFGNINKDTKYQFILETDEFSYMTAYYNFEEHLKTLDDQQQIEAAREKWEDDCINSSVSFYVDDNFSYKDFYYRLNQLYTYVYSDTSDIIFIAVACSVLALILLIYLLANSGKTKTGKSFLCKLPFEIVSILLAVGLIIGMSTLYNFYEYSPTIYDTESFYIFALSVVIYFAMYIVSLFWLMCLIAQMKNKTLVKSSIIYNVCKFINGHINLILKFSLFFAAFIFVQICYIASVGSYMIVLALMAIDVFIAVVGFYVIFAFSKIKSGIEKLSKGENDAKVDTDMLIGSFKQVGENFNSISDSIEIAVNERMKSEYFKTELITNVSHDIKTPLTSIINYSDLICKEETDNEQIKQYSDVLYRQSNRLKKLIEDLLEASKASTGNLKVDLQPCSVTTLLSQIVGEYSEKFEKSQLELICTQNTENIQILADSRHLYRVFENLLNNICKYAQQNTRVYLIVELIENKVKISIKNISRYPLNITADELMERFVRGDSSRNSDGNGLGLSIARSLTELQHGNLKLEIDGDLFKSIILFDSYETQMNN